MMSDEQYGAVVLRSLDDEPRSPTTVDLGRALADGRRRRRVRKISGYCAGAAAAACLLAGTTALVATQFLGGPPPVVGQSAPATSAASPTSTTTVDSPVPPTACTVEPLPIPDGPVKSIVTDGDATGRYIVGRSYGAEMKVWVWENGTPRQARMPGEDERLEDINQSGVGVGFSYVGNVVKPYVYRNGEVTELPGSGTGAALAINASGWIVGYDGSETRPVIWHSPTAAPVALPTPPGGGRATDIGDDGTAVGQVGDRPYAWGADGSGRFLPMPASLKDRGAEFLQIRNEWVIGRTMTGSREIGLRWNLRTGEVGEVRQFADRPSRVNGYGWMTGYDSQHRAILVTQAGTLIMPDLHMHKADHFTNMPNAISDDGRRIAGDAYDKGIDDNLAVLWRCG